jgi:beta-glucosidase
MSRVAGAIAEECKSWGINQVLSPVINLATDVRWGRVEETYGEDPFLTSAMGVSFVNAFEKRGIVTTPKHFVVNHGDGGRDSYPVNLSERFLEQTYFVPFKELLKNGKSRSIMTSYNSFNGRPCSANNWLLNEKLKKEWGFTGFVISDAGATGGANVLHFTAEGYEDAGKQAIENGLDVIFQMEFDSYKLFSKPFLKEDVSSVAVDSAVARVLRVKFGLGLFDQPYVDINNLKTDFSEHRRIAREASLKSIVLLKNDEKKVLPLSSEYKNIALIGVDAVESRLGGYSSSGNSKISILEGLKEILGNKSQVHFAEGCGRKHSEWVTVESDFLSYTGDGISVKGLKGEYFNNIELKGAPVMIRTDEKIHFQWTLFSPDPAVNYDFFSVKWTGFITSPFSGLVKIGVEGNEGYRVFIDDKLIIDTWNLQGYSMTTKDFDFEKSKKYKIRIEYKEPSGNSRFRLIWNAGAEDNSEKKIEEAVELGKNSDIIIVAAGIEEGEFNDRSSLKLSGKQEEMILKLAETGKPIVVILVGGSAISMEIWKDKVNAIIDVWYPGEAGGEAIAEILTGKANPSGKLPITFPVSEGQLPLVYNHLPTGRGDDYSDETGQPLFPFGFGLSYTRFEYSYLTFNMKQINTNDTLMVSCNIKNTGDFDGEEVVQLYLFDELSYFARPVKELKGFQRVSLKKGEQKNISFMLTPDVFSVLNEELKKVTEPGFFRIMIGSSSKDIRLRDRIEIK